MSVYTSGEVRKLTDVQYDSLDYYATHGIVTPSIKPARGTGNDRLWSFGDVVALAVIRRAASAGFAIAHLAGLIEYLRRREYSVVGPPLGYVVWTGDWDVVEVDESALGSEVYDRTAKGRAAFVLNLSGLFDDLKAKGA